MSKHKYDAISRPASSIVAIHPEFRMIVLGNQRG